MKNKFFSSFFLDMEVTSGSSLKKFSVVSLSPPSLSGTTDRIYLLLLYLRQCEQSLNNLPSLQRDISLSSKLY